MQHPRLQKILFCSALLCTLLLPRVAVAQASKVILTFYMLTASHAALGAPMQYQLTLTNTGTTQVQVESKVSLIAPNRTTCIELDTMPTLNPGQVLGTSGTFKTSDCDSETGAPLLPVSNGMLYLQSILPVNPSSHAVLAKPNHPHARRESHYSWKPLPSSPTNLGSKGSSIENKVLLGFVS